MNDVAIFWRDWENRLPGERRSLDRARHLVTELHLDDLCPVIEVVGSKGKGTAATYCSAYLAAAGRKVVTVTSPGLRGARDRIRLNGRAISEESFRDLGRRLAQAHASLPPYRPGAGYLSPSGLFIIAGVLYSKLCGADTLVLEAGMGGASDEISLFSPTIVAVASIFGEHLGVLGDTVPEIAAEKAGVISHDTRAVISLPQEKAVREVLSEAVQTRSGGKAGLDIIHEQDSGIPSSLLPRGPSRANAELGCVAAARFLEECGHQPADGQRVTAVLETVRLPGRASRHVLQDGRTQLFLDAAISRTGLAAALAEAYLEWPAIDHVLLCMPDHKDVGGAVSELAGLPVTYVRLADKARLKFTRSIPDDWTVVDAAEVDAEFVAKYGPRVVALGTGYFIQHMLKVADADTETLFTAPA